MQNTITLHTRAYKDTIRRYYVFSGISHQFHVFGSNCFGHICDVAVSILVHAFHSFNETIQQKV